MSLVVPAYNEARRLPPYLDAIRAYLDKTYGGAYEVLVVDDGSTDGTRALLDVRAKDWPQLRCIPHAQNQGKGAAVRTGVLAACGDRILFADADGATPIQEEGRLAAAIGEGADLAIGSRLIAAPQKRRERPWSRRLAGKLFAQLATRMLGLRIRDPQCGFKMFSREAGRRLFTLCQQTDFLFDVEILALAQQAGYRTAEIGIDWSEQPDGHFSLARSSLHAIGQLWRLRRRLK